MRSEKSRCPYDHDPSPIRVRTSPGELTLGAGKMDANRSIRHPYDHDRSPIPPRSSWCELMLGTGKADADESLWPNSNSDKDFTVGADAQQKWIQSRHSRTSRRQLHTPPGLDRVSCSHYWNTASPACNARRVIETESPGKRLSISSRLSGWTSNSSKARKTARRIAST